LLAQLAHKKASEDYIYFSMMTLSILRVRFVSKSVLNLFLT